jgi:hypothetical protein
MNKDYNIESPSYTCPIIIHYVNEAISHADIESLLFVKLLLATLLLVE